MQALRPAPGHGASPLHPRRGSLPLHPAREATSVISPVVMPRWLGWPTHSWADFCRGSVTSRSSSASRYGVDTGQLHSGKLNRKCGGVSTVIGYDARPRHSRGMTTGSGHRIVSIGGGLGAQAPQRGPGVGPRPGRGAERPQAEPFTTNMCASAAPPIPRSAIGYRLSALYSQRLPRRFPVGATVRPPGWRARLRAAVPEAARGGASVLPPAPAARAGQIPGRAR